MIVLQLYWYLCSFLTIFLHTHNQTTRIRSSVVHSIDIWGGVLRGKKCTKGKSLTKIHNNTIQHGHIIFDQDTESLIEVGHN